MHNQTLETFDGSDNSNTLTNLNLLGEVSSLKDFDFTRKNTEATNNAINNAFGGLTLVDGNQRDNPFKTDARHTDAVDKRYTHINKIVDKDTVKAIRRNEEDDSGRGFLRRQTNNSWLERRLDKNGLAGDSMSVGPAQLQRKHIEQLRKKYPHLKDVDHHTKAGADKFVAAYLNDEAYRFDKGAYRNANDRNNPRSDEDPKIREYFEKMQKHWDKAKKAGDKETMRKILIQSYNIGGGRRYLARVEAQRTGKSVQKEAMPILTQ